MTRQLHCTLLFLFSLLLLMSYSAHSHTTQSHRANQQCNDASIAWPEPFEADVNRTNYHSSGNVRVRLCVSEYSTSNVSDIPSAVSATIHWRRRDQGVEQKNFFILHAASGKQVLNVQNITLNREALTVLFEPAQGAGEYHLYYLPHTIVSQAGGFFPLTTYDPPNNTASSDWSAYWTAQPLDSIAVATTLEFQPRVPFHAFSDMERIALQSELQSLQEQYANETYLLYPTDRSTPLRLTNSTDFPVQWIRTGPYSASNIATFNTARGEFLFFQIGLYALKQDITVNNIVYPTEPAFSNWTCINLGGNDDTGIAFRKNFTVPAGRVNALWIGTQVGKDAVVKLFEQLELTLQFEGLEDAAVQVAINITDAAVMQDHGDSDLTRLARLRWIDSTIGLTGDDYDVVPPPFKPIILDETNRVLTLSVDRQLTLNEYGLPASVDVNARAVLASDVQFVLETEDTSPVSVLLPTYFYDIHDSTASWYAIYASQIYQVQVNGTLFFDGFVDYRITLTNLQDNATLPLYNTQLTVPYVLEAAVHEMGMSVDGRQRRNTDRAWQWVQPLGDNMIWFGDVNCGMRFKLKGEDASWDNPLHTIDTATAPASWYNNGAGGANITYGQDTVTVSAFSGSLELPLAASLTYNFDFMITPLRVLDTAAHFNARFYQVGYPQSNYVSPQAVRATGANIVNIHQGVSTLNPYINYPFVPDEVPVLSNYTAEAKSLGMRSKFYYTIRELTNHVQEIWALRSLGDEIYLGGDGTSPAFVATSWLQEHVVEQYQPCWQQILSTGEMDSALCNNGVSRWVNYYLHGLDWSLANNPPIDGLYYDGINFSHLSMMRMRRILYRNNPEAINDFHSGDNFRYFPMKASVALTYMHLWPYIDHLWLGGMFNYSETPEFYLVESSGIPFGLMNDILAESNYPTATTWNAFYGLLYGMTARYQTSNTSSEVWQLYDAFGIAHASMLGWWNSSLPVNITADDPAADVRCTAYVNYGNQTLLVLASWSSAAVNVTLQLDWDAVGLSPNNIVLHAPALTGIQGSATFSLTDVIPLQPFLGTVLLVQPSQHATQQLLTLHNDFATNIFATT